MAVNKRSPVKWIRDRAKSAYEKEGNCYICGTEEELEFHHYKSVTLLFERWAKKNKLSIKTDDDIKACRDQFIEEHKKELYEECVTLCNTHHKNLHRIYGGKPTLPTGPKQIRWVEKQRDKFIQ